jgi:hypothetical protein
MYFYDLVVGVELSLYFNAKIGKLKIQMNHYNKASGGIGEAITMPTNVTLAEVMKNSPMVLLSC